MIRVVAASEDDALVAFGAAGVRTVADLRRDVASVADRLPSEKNGQVLVIAEDRYLFAVAVLAAWCRDFGVILPPNTRGAAIDALAAEAGATILHDADVDVGIDLKTCLSADGQPDFARPLTSLAGQSASPGALTRWPPALDDECHAVTLFTSGSTQAFRGVPKLARQLYREVAALQATFGLSPDTHVVATVPPNHLYGFLFSVLWPLAVGAPFCRDVPLHVEAIADLVVVPGAAVLVTVPAHLAGFVRLAPRRLAGVRVFSSTAPLQARLALELTHAQGLDLVEVFGSTETGGIGWRRAEQGQGWHPLAGVTVGVDDEHLQIESDFLPDRSPYRTEDRVQIQADGTFVHLGRTDDIVKVGGRRISLGHIERCLRQIPGVQDASVIAVPDEGVRGTRILAAVVAPGLDASHLRNALAVWLDPATTPRRYALVDALPREPNGKLRRDRVLALFQAGSIRLSPVESTESGVWCFDVHVPEGAWYFEGHFPGYPILPGVATLHAIVVPAIVSRGVQGMLREVRRLKFRHPVRPGQQLALRVVHHADTFEFSLTRDGLVVASGRLRFA